MSWFCKDKRPPIIIPNNKVWYRVVLEEYPQGGQLLPFEVTQTPPCPVCGSDTKHIYNPKSGGLTHIVYIQEYTGQEAVTKAQHDVEFLTRTGQMSDYWEKARDLWMKQVAESAEHDRLSKPATIADLEELEQRIMAAIKDKEQTNG